MQNNIGLITIINDIPNPRKNVFKLNGKEIVHEIALNTNPIGNSIIATTHSLVKFSFQIINVILLNS